MDETYIKLFRKFLKWEWYTDVITTKLFIHCLLRANYIDQNYRGEIIKAGSFVTGLDKLAHETGLTIRQVRTALKHLKLTNEVTSVSNSKGTIITVNNWLSYQSNDKQSDKPKTNERQTNDKQVTTIKERKKDIKKESKNKDIYILVDSLVENDLLNAKLKEFIDMRKSIKSPMTENAVKLLLNKLNELSEDVDIQIQILDQSIISNWKSVYELKDIKSKKELSDKEKLNAAFGN